MSIKYIIHNMKHTRIGLLDRLETDVKNDVNI